MVYTGAFTFAAIFYFMAEYEHLTGWKWALASLAVTFTVEELFPLSFILVLPAQFGLFCVLWWYHLKAKAARDVERAQRQQEDQRLRRERVSAAQKEAGTDTEWQAREAERAAADEAARNERQERVRRAREEREREERERKPGT